MRAKHWVGFLLIALMASACGDDTGKVSTHSRDPNGSAGKGGTRRDAGMAAFDAGEDEPRDAEVAPPMQTKDATTPVDPAADPRAPVVEILEPKALKDPNSGDVLTKPLVTVHCKVTKSTAAGAQNVNENGVKITLVNLADPKKSTGATVKNVGGGEFTADFDLSEHGNGALEFACQASDVGKPPLMTVATVDTFLDLGPTIELLTPSDGTAHALKTAVQIDFRVTDSPVSLDDQQAATTDIHLLVSGQEFEFTEDKDEKGLYHASVNFNERDRFPMPPTSAEIIVNAKSSRSPEPATRSVRSLISIDADGPVIAITKPEDQEIVKGDVQIQLAITDASGVDQSTVVATVKLGSKSYPITEWDVNKNTYVGHFDTNGFDQNRTISQMTINVDATDIVGNEAMTASVLIRLDNVPPILSMDPPMIREYQVKNGANRCSETFDPVGHDATNDLEQVTVESMYRVMVWDRTNEARGQNFLYLAGVKDSTVQIYTQPDPNIPLLVDTNGDGQCDEIKNDLTDPEKNPAALDLTQIKKKGSATYLTTADFTADPPSIACAQPQTNAGEETPLCAATEMFRAIPQPLDDPNPPGAIFAAEANNMATGACNGVTWDLYRITDREGWTCLAARATDNIGNVGISPPLRVCINDGDDSNGIPDCTPSVGDAIKCSDGCTWPVTFAPHMVLLAK